MPKPPISAIPEMISSGMSVLARWMCSARGRICSSAKRWKVSRTSSKSASRCRGPSTSARDDRNSGSRKVATNASAGAIQSPATPHSRVRPMVRAARSATASAAKAQAIRASVSPARPVGQRRPGGAHGRRRVGHVVGQHLGRVRSTGPVECGDAGVDHRLGDGDSAGRGHQVGNGRLIAGHRPRLPKRPCRHRWWAARPARWPGGGRSGPGVRATTVTRGGRTTGSSPGSTSVSTLR